MYQGNGDGTLLSQGPNLDDWLPSPVITMQGGTAGNFDSCGSWIMRSLTTDAGKVLGFYHAETACTYAGGQTRKSGGYAVSSDGGRTFTKPDYPLNKLVDTSTPIIPGIPTGEGDFSIILRGDYYYMFFANVEDYHTGVARAPKSSDAYPGSFQKYLNGAWNQPAVGGTSSRLNNIAGPQAYVHTPSNSIFTVGNANPYWNQGFQVSVSDDALNWAYFADPVFTPDPLTNLDTVMYPSFLGPTGGYDIGSAFKFFYMWIPPGSDWNHRYQIHKDVTLTYIGQGSTVPMTKVALTTFRNKVTNEAWQSTELALPPYSATGIVGYLMTRPYPNSFVVYDCFNYTTSDHFVGTADECFLSGAGVTVIRTLGYLYSFRANPTIAVYRCYAGTDLFLSQDNNCEGLAPSQSTPFGYALSGPAFAMGTDVLVAQGSTWFFWNQSYAPASGWNQLSFDTSNWGSGRAPFSDSYAVESSFFGNRDYYFRQKFTVPAGKTVKKLLISLASDDYSIVYVNGKLVDSDTVSWHEASYWNRRVYIDVSTLTAGDNMLGIITKNLDNWAFFDAEVRATYVSTSQSKRSVEFEEEEVLSLDQELTEHGRDKRIARPIPRLVERAEKRADTNTLIAAGSSWKYVTYAPASTWISPSFDDSQWATSSAPFVTGYSAYVGVGTPFGASDYYFRAKFTIPTGKSLQSLQVSVASDNYAIVYINGALVDSDPSSWHQAAYWNRQVNVDVSLVASGVNTIAVVTKNMDQWAFFDLQLNAVFAATTLPTGMLIAAGSNWLYTSAVPSGSWTQLSFDDSAWKSSPAPFVTGYTAYQGVGTPFGPTDYYFRGKFTLPTGQTVATMQVSVASDNYAIVYVNGQVVDSDPSTWHEATYWNRQVTVPTSVLVAGVNVIAVVTKNQDAWAFFDCQLSATYVATSVPTLAPTAAPTQAPSQGGTATLVQKGSTWSYVTYAPASSWNTASFDDSQWSKSGAPFVTGYSAYVGVGTPFGAMDYYFRQKFTISSTVQSVQVSVASDNYALVYVNGQLVDSDPSSWHQATYWNRQVTIDPAILTSGNNVLAVVVKNQDAWAFFDAQLTVVYSGASSTPANGMLIPQGSSWKYTPSQPSAAWQQSSFDDSAWTQAASPFVTGYSAYQGVGTPFGASNYYFRAKFSIPSGSTLSRIQLSVASDNYAVVYINGVQVDADPSSWHQAAYWNRQVYIDTSMITTGSNTIAVVTYNQDQWAFFDLQLYAEYSSGGSQVSTTCNPVCGVRGQCIAGQCVCDSGWGGSDCNTNLCTYSGNSNTTIIPAGSSFRHMQWSTVASTPVGWFAPTYDDSWWQLNSAPFGTTFYSGVSTIISGYRHLYRKKFLIDVPYGQMIRGASLFLATDDTHRVYINGKFVGAPIFPYNSHYAKYWNDVINIDGSLLGAVNVISVEVPLVDGRWTAFFDMQMVVTFSTKTCTRS
jgi:hypothetical protein